MNCQIFITVFINILLIIHAGYTIINNKLTVYGELDADELSADSTGIILLAKVNNTENVDFDIDVSPNYCCLLDDDLMEICDVLDIIGKVDTVDRGSSKTIKLVAPLLQPIERRGYCKLFVDSKPKVRQSKSVREVITIQFDTRAKYLPNIDENIASCTNVDEDPLNDCYPVDCESYYNGKRSYFDDRIRRCVKIQTCIPNDKETPDSVLDVKKNKCVIGQSITDADINLIKQLTAKPRTQKDIIIMNFKTNPTLKKEQILSSENVTTKLLAKNTSVSLNSINGKLNRLKDEGLKYFSTNFVPNKCTIIVLTAVVLVQCCLICTIVICMGKTFKRLRQKKTEHKYFNYNQDASVTTPLICTSTVDTGTTDYRYTCESSNIDTKIKCYKACQKDRQNAKMSMSDDILLKCLTRRDWNSKPDNHKGAIAENVEELTKAAERRKRYGDEITTTLYHSQNVFEARKTSGVKVNFENERTVYKKRDVVKTNIPESKSKRNINDYNDSQNKYSEKEIHSHNYNYPEEKSNITGFKPSGHRKWMNVQKTERTKSQTVSMSTEKGAQVVLPNDSIDDIISLKEMEYVPAEDLSKYSIFTQNTKSTTSSEISNKTSKHNMGKGILGLFSKKLKRGPSSDSGVIKPESNMNMEIIHMSNASMGSISNYGSEFLTGKKPITRSSF